MARKRLKEAAQHKAFKEAARELGCDESEGSFDRALGKIGKSKVPPVAKKPKRRPVKIALPDA
jgi:hypothetical protein